ncbi:hypothetical protein A8W25_28490 [Streptomyces sp. ERV7]|uniref:hypothetical protein n=1 Tax=Streptomyces sp. ERV7 TaxID=1322334 RepID=UPI0007F34BFF|nr:hypothetical protein [Streptomyces sp. ERV7]OAR25082.1 hypothetical protein A8W25_28490 [Streptomyces sp. ERV7]
MSRWAEHLSQAVSLSPARDTACFLHLSVRLHPEDRRLTEAEWSEIAHRLARTAGLAPRADGGPCRWIAVRRQRDRLHLIAGLIREDGSLPRTSRRLSHELAQQARIMETEFGLVPARPPAGRQEQVIADPLVTAEETPAQIAEKIRQLTDETDGTLAEAWRLAEQAAHRLAERPEIYALRTARQMKWAARRLYGLLQGLDAAAEDLANPPALLRNAVVGTTRTRCPSPQTRRTR